MDFPAGVHVSHFAVAVASSRSEYSSGWPAEFARTKTCNTLS
jgi:hypothetical protein